MTFDPNKTLVVALVYPDAALTTDAAEWLARHRLLPGRMFYYMRKDSIDMVRCAAVAAALKAAGPEVEQFLLLDRDMRPDARSDPVLTADGDVVGATYPLPRADAWADAGAVHLGLVRVHRRVFEALLAQEERKPLFYFARTPDGARATGCECHWFASRAQQAGFTVVRAGYAEHGQRKREA